MMSQTRLMNNLAVYQKIKKKENRFVLGFFRLLLFRKNSDKLTEHENLFIKAQNQIKSELDRGNNEAKIQFSEKELTHIGKPELIKINKEVQKKSQNLEVDSRILKLLDEDVTFVGALKK